MDRVYCFYDPEDRTRKHHTSLFQQWPDLKLRWRTQTLPRLKKKHPLSNIISSDIASQSYKPEILMVISSSSSSVRVYLNDWASRSTRDHQTWHHAVSLLIRILFSLTCIVTISSCLFSSKRRSRMFSKVLLKLFKMLHIFIC